MKTFCGITFDEEKLDSFITNYKEIPGDLNSIYRDFFSRSDIIQMLDTDNFEDVYRQ